MINITLDDREVRQALERLQRRLSDLSPVMRDIGELLVERAKQRFEASTAPDGSRWAPNSAATLGALLARSRANFRKDGSLSKRGTARKAGKKPLIDTGTLMGQMFYRASASEVTVGNTMRYAAIHQFGGQAGRGKKVTIPARPFLPVTATGQWLGSDDRNAVLDILRSAIQTAADGG